MINVGTDIIEIKRIEKIYRKYDNKFLNRFFTKDEIKYIESKNFNVETMAGILSGKESVSKALGLGIGKLKWKDIEIKHTSRGRPIVYIDEAKLKELDRPIYNFSISISHEKNYAISFVIAYKLCKEGNL